MCHVPRSDSVVFIQSMKPSSIVIFAAFLTSLSSFSCEKGWNLNGELLTVEASFDPSSSLYVLRTTNRQTFDAGNRGWVAGGVFDVVAPHAFEFVRLNSAALPGVLASCKSGSWSDPALVSAHTHLGLALQVLADEFDWHGHNSKALPTKIAANFSYKYNGALWNEGILLLGGGDGQKFSNFAGSLDIIGHELGHRVLELSSHLSIEGEAGALNEAFSDILGVYIETKAMGRPPDWLIGEDIYTPHVSGDALRYLDDPTRDRKENNQFYSRDHWQNRFTGAEDLGGVHYNSGIVNLMFYLLSEGGFHPRVDSKLRVKGIGIQRAITILYTTFTQRLSGQASFAEAKNKMIELAQDLYGEDIAQSVSDAWLSVGV